MNKVYPKAKEGFMSGGINLLTDPIRAAIVDAASYTYSDTHQFLTDVPTRIADSQLLTSKTVTNGNFDCTNPVFSAVPAGGPHEYLVLFVDTGVAATSELLVFTDTATGLPVTPNGTDVTVNLGSYYFGL